MEYKGTYCKKFAVGAFGFFVALQFTFFAKMLDIYII